MYDFEQIFLLDFHSLGVIFSESGVGVGRFPKTQSLGVVLIWI